MSDKKPLIINADGYVLVLREELLRLTAIEERARLKLNQLRIATDNSDRRMAHIEALAFVLVTDDAITATNEHRKGGGEG